MFAFMYPYAEIQVPVASLMAQASHLSEQITQLLQHDRLEIQEHYKAWVHVRCRFQKAEGWILKAQVQPLTDAAFHAHPFGIVLPGLRPETPDTFLPGTFLFTPHEAATPFAAIERTEKQLQDLLTFFMYTPYRWGGLTCRGIDCSGLSALLYRFFNLPLACKASLQFEQGVLIDFLQEARCGDLAFFEEEGSIHHVGILWGPGEIIHASEGNGNVRLDKLDAEGILNGQSGQRTHRLRLIRRV